MLIAAGIGYVDFLFLNDVLNNIFTATKLSIWESSPLLSHIKNLSNYIPVSANERPLIQPGHTLEEPQNMEAGESSFSRIQVAEPKEFDMKDFPKPAHAEELDEENTRRQ